MATPTVPTHFAWHFQVFSPANTSFDIAHLNAGVDNFTEYDYCYQTQAMATPNVPTCLALASQM